MIFRFLIILFLCASQVAMAQDKCLPKAKEFLAKQRYPKVVKMATKGIEKNSKEAEWYFLQAAAELEMSEIPEYRENGERHFKAAVKSLKKGMERDENKRLAKGYDSYVQRIIILSNAEAETYYYQGRYSKAIIQYRDNYELTGDTLARTMLGMSYYKNGAIYNGIEILKPMARVMYGAWYDSVSLHTLKWEPYATLGDYYIEQKLFDSARLYTEMGLEMFPGHPTLRVNAKNLLVDDLRKSAMEGITVSFIEIVNKGLSFFPNDTFFLTNQNAYYLDKLNRYTNSGEDGLADTAFTEFYNAKRYIQRKGSANESDKFAYTDSGNFIYKGLDYGLRTNSRKMAAYFFKRWFTALNKFPKYTEFHAEKLLTKPDTNVSRRLTSIMFEDGRRNYPKNNKIKQAQLAYFKQWMKEESGRVLLDDKLAMCSNLINDFGRTPELKKYKIELLTRIYVHAMEAGIMEEAWDMYHSLRAETGNPLENMLKEVTKRDFEIRYVGSAIAYATVGKTKIAQTGWTGNSRYCEPGRMPDSTLSKVIGRINYFRQNAGIQGQMKLSRKRLAYSQAAAIMYAGKGVFTREPEAGTHACMSEEGAEAAKIVQAVLDNNPAQSLTNLMNDRKSLETVNRQALLNIGNEYCGFGSAEDNSVFWLLDTANTSGDNYHKTKPVVWPPEGSAPVMLMFNKWSIALYADLAVATIKVRYNGNEVDIKNKNVQALPGIKLQTLIYEPQIAQNMYKQNDVIEVVMTLKGGKEIKYRTELFQYEK